MSVSAIYGTRIAVVPLVSTTVNGGSRAVKFHPSTTGGALTVECSSRPQKKGTAHHMKTRPKKTARWDIKRKPTVYAPLPPLPAEWTIVSSGSDEADEATAEPASTETQSE